MQCAPITHEEGSTWPHCHTFVFILGNLSLPVVISEWHMVEVLTRFKHIRQAGIDAIHGGSRAVLRERKSPPPLVSRQNWGSESVTPQLCFLTPLLLLLEKIVLCPKGIQIHLVLDNREQTKACSFTLEQHCLTDATAEEPKNDKTALKQLKSRKEKSGLNCHATLSASWGTPGHCCIYISYFVKSLFCRDICSEQGIHEETQRVVTVVD